MTGNRWTLSQAAAALLSLIALGQASPGHALPGKCLLRVDGQTYLDSICNVDVTVTDGSFSIGTGESARAKHFAVVNVGPIKGRAIGYWNGVAGEDHAHESLGVLIRQGACWSNARAKICAVRN